jgi:hypothetical protein
VRVTADGHLTNLPGAWLLAKVEQICDINDISVVMLEEMQPSVTADYLLL